MKHIIAAILLAFLALPAFAADTSVRGYTRKDGTYVQPHMRSAPNSTTQDNFSTRGNVNPYTGQIGTRDPYPNSSPSFGYQPPQPVQPYQPYQPYGTQPRQRGLLNDD